MSEYASEKEEQPHEERLQVSLPVEKGNLYLQ